MDSKPNDVLQEPVVIPSQNEHTQDMMVDEEAKNESTGMGPQEPAETIPDIHTNDTQNNILVSVEEGPSLDKDNKQTSSTHLEQGITHPDPSNSTKEFDEKKSTVNKEAFGKGISTKEALGRVDEQLNNVQKVKESSNESAAEERSGKTVAAIPPTIAQRKDSTFNPAITSSDDTSPLGDNKISRQFEKDHDLIRLFQLLEKDADTGVRTHFVSEYVVDKDDTKVAEAFTYLEASLKMNLNEIANSKENNLHLHNALDFLSSHYFEDGASSYGLKPKIDSLQQKIQTVVSSFKQASSTIHTFTELQGKEKCMMNEELPRRKEEAMSLISEIDDTERSLGEAKQKEEKLKEHISRLQSELNNNDKEIKDCEIKLLSLKRERE